jgi:hypothetical protein
MPKIKVRERMLIETKGLLGVLIDYPDEIELLPSAVAEKFREDIGNIFTDLLDRCQTLEQGIAKVKSDMKL